LGITTNLEHFPGKTGTSALWLLKAHETVAQIAVLPEYHWLSANVDQSPWLDTSRSRALHLPHLITRNAFALPRKRQGEISLVFTLDKADRSLDLMIAGPT